MSALPGDSTEDLRLYLLVLRCQAGDEQAFARLFAWFGPRTLVLLRGMVNDEAEDVQQEVWLSVYRQLSTLSNPRAFRNWLFRTTRHRAIDCLRRQRRDNELFSEASDADVIAEVDGAESARLDPEAVKELLDALPPLLREAVTLRYLNDLTYGEIALVMGCPVGTVRSRLFHARQRLEQLLVSRRGLRESNERTADTSKQGDER